MGCTKLAMTNHKKRVLILKNRFHSHSILDVSFEPRQKYMEKFKVIRVYTFQNNILASNIKIYQKFATWPLILKKNCC